MVALVVGNPDKVIKAFLLLQEVEPGGLGRVLFQGQVHAFVTAVLLGMAGVDALDLDAEAQPPSREPGEAEQGIECGKGGPLSVRRAWGRPKSLKVRSKSVKAKSERVEATRSQASRLRDR